MKMGQLISSNTASGLAPLRLGGVVQSRTPVRVAQVPAGQKKVLRLLVADDHPVVRKGLASCLDRQSGLQVVGEAGDGQQAIQKARELTPDLVLMDIDMPNMDGLTATEALLKELPDTKVLILSMSTNTDHALRILESGARGYVLKGASVEELLQAVEAVCAGRTFFSPEVARLTLDQFVKGNHPGSAGSMITQRERQVLIAIAEGLTNKEIACRLNVGVRTVETHRERIMRKLNIHSIAGLTKYALAKGWITLPAVLA